jgi:hypothetical protein
MSLQYDEVDHLHCKLTLRSGRTTTLEAIYQRMSYAGITSGTPDKSVNDEYVEAAFKAAQTLCIQRAKPHLIPPSRRDYFREPGDMREGIERRPTWIPEWLPMVRCIGSFLSPRPARDPKKDASVLVVVSGSRMSMRCRSTRLCSNRSSISTGKSWPRTSSTSEPRPKHRLPRGASRPLAKSSFRYHNPYRDWIRTAIAISQFQSESQSCQRPR